MEQCESNKSWDKEGRGAAEVSVPGGMRWKFWLISKLGPRETASNRSRKMSGDPPVDCVPKLAPSSRLSAEGNHSCWLRQWPTDWTLAKVSPAITQFSVVTSQGFSVQLAPFKNCLSWDWTKWLFPLWLTGEFLKNQKVTNPNVRVIHGPPVEHLQWIRNTGLTRWQWRCYGCYGVAFWGRNHLNNCSEGAPSSVTKEATQFCL